MTLHSVVSAPTHSISRSIWRSTGARLAAGATLLAAMACEGTVINDDYEPYVAVVYGTVARDGMPVADVNVEAVVARDSAFAEQWRSTTPDATGEYRLEVTSFSPGPFPVIVRPVTGASSVRTDSLQFSRVSRGPTDSASVHFEF